jgi:hypothetical protein
MGAGASSGHDRAGQAIGREHGRKGPQHFDRLAGRGAPSGGIKDMLYVAGIALEPAEGEPGVARRHAG